MKKFTTFPKSAKSVFCIINVFEKSLVQWQENLICIFSNKIPKRFRCKKILNKENFNPRGAMICLPLSLLVGQEEVVNVCFLRYLQQHSE